MDCFDSASLLILLHSCLKWRFFGAPVLERVRRRQYYRRPRVFRDRTNPLEALSDDEVLYRLRLPREIIFRLCGELVELDPLGRRGGSLPVSIQLCIALRYLATGSFQDMVGELHGVSQPTGRFRFSISLLIPLDPGLDLDPHYEANLYM